MLFGYKKKKLTLLLISWIFSCSNIFTQTRQLNFINYNVKDGMSHGIVDDLFRDSEGFLWIATYNGLDRFDGTNFKVFHADYHDPNAIVDDYVQQICEDHKGNIWCGCDKGVSCYSKITGKFKNYHLTNPNGLSVEANLIYNILCDRHGVIWCSSSAGIFEYDPRQDNFKGYYHSESNPASISSDRIFKNSFVEDPVKDGIWISGPNGINFLDLKTKIFYNYRNNPDKNPIFFNQEIYPLTFDHHNNLWFSIRFKSELYCYDFIQQTLTKEIIHSNEKKASAPFNVATLFFDSKGNTWFSTWSTKVYFREKNQVEFSRVVHDDINPNSINSSFFWDVMEDVDGTLWFGGLNGISKFQPSAQFYSLLKPNESLPANQQFKTINAILQQDDSLLWLGTAQGLYIYNLVSGDCKKIINLPDDNFPINFIIKKQEEFWLVGDTGIHVIDPRTKKPVNKNPMPRELIKTPQYISQVYVCRNGNIWMLARNTDKLFYLKKGSDQWHSFTHRNNDPHSPPQRMSLGMFEEADGTMWFGCLQDGLMRFDEANSRFDFFRNAHTGSSTITILNVGSIVGFRKNELYLIPFRTGLIKFRCSDSSAVLFKQSDGLATESNFNAVIDRDENIWLAGYQDVTQLNTKTNAITRFHIDYSNDKYDYSNALLALTNGDIAISVSDAIAVYKPKMIVDEIKLPHVLISDFSVFEKSLPFTQQNADIHLTYKQDFFSISFSTFSGSKNDVQYAYRLEGFDKDWVYCGKRQIASYTNVPGGDYTFLVRVSTRKGVWSLPSTVHIVVTPPFWQTVWFKFLLAVVSIIIIAILFKIRESNYRAKQEQKLQVLKVRNKIAQDLHDDIGASLSSIRMYSEALRMQIKEKLPQVDLILERISENSKEIVDNMSDIVWAINPKNDSLQFMEDRMHAFASAVCSSKNIIPHFNKIDFHQLKLPMEMRKNIFLIFKEAINNAAKYSGCKNIFVNMQMQNRMFMLSITDDGEGFDITNAANGNGLTNMRKRAKELQGEISIISELNKGTIINLSLLLPEVSKAIPSNGE